MSKDVTAPMLAHLALPTTTLATAWIIERRDGVTFRYTSNSEDVTAEFGLGEGTNLYKAQGGYSRTNLATTDDMDVENLDLLGFTDDEITSADLRAGLWAYGKVRPFLFNHQDTSAAMGVIKLPNGFLGETRVTPAGLYEAEMRGLLDAFTHDAGELYQKDCKDDLGGPRCRIPIEPSVIGRNQFVGADTLNGLDEFYRVQTDPVPPAPPGDSRAYEDRIYKVISPGTTAGGQPTYNTTVGQPTADGTAVLEAEESWTRAAQVVAVDSGEPRRIFTVSELTPNTGGPRGGFPDDWMNFGGATFETGNNSGIAREVKDFVADDGVTIEQVIELYKELPRDAVVGDRLRTFPGCDLTFATCKAKFANVRFIAAEPYGPGDDFFGQYADAP